MCCIHIGSSRRETAGRWTERGRKQTSGPTEWLKQYTLYCTALSTVFYISLILRPNPISLFASYPSAPGTRSLGEVVQIYLHGLGHPIKHMLHDQ